MHWGRGEAAGGQYEGGQGRKVAHLERLHQTKVCILHKVHALCQELLHHQIHFWCGLHRQPSQLLQAGWQQLEVSVKDESTQKTRKEKERS